MANRSVDFFEEQFQRQVAAREFTLNPFEEAALPYVSGRVLDLACGLGNLSATAARKGCEVVAVDASPAAVGHVSSMAREEKLDIHAVRADVERYEIDGTFDTAIAIGILMFFPREVALAILERVQRAVRPGGRAVVTVLIHGTTFTQMFDGARHYLFEPDELERAFTGWTILLRRTGEFPAPNGTVKRFSTVIAQRP